jgi:sugar phosphate isomerase/epimerase
MGDVIGGAGDADAFERARRLGFLGVEPALSRSELRSSNPGRLESLRRAKAESGLSIPSLVLSEHLYGGICDSSPGVAAEAAEDVRQAIVWAADLGAGIILIPFFLAARLQSADDVSRCADAFRALCPLAADRGVTLCFEGTLASGEVRYLAERVDSRAFGCYFDLANPLVWGLDPVTELRALRDLIRGVHLKDTRVTPGDCPPGLGRVDFERCALALTEIGYDGWLVFETPRGPLEMIARDLSFARSVFPTLEGETAWPRFGAFSYDFGAGEWERLGETFQRLGLEAVQLGGDLLAECLAAPERIEPARRALEQRGVSIAALAGYRNLTAPDPDMRQRNIEWMQSCLQLAPLFGTSIVATESGTRHPNGDWTDSPDNWSPQARALLDDVVGTLLPAAEQTGTLLAVEGTVTNVLRTVGQLLGLLERFPSRHLQVVCDPYNYVSSHLLPAQERVTDEFLGRFEHRFAVAHLKDVGPSGAEVETPEFGTGVFAQRPYLEFLRSRRPDLPLIVEHLPLDHIPDAIRRVRETVRTSLPA